MACDRSAFRAIVDPARLENIVERETVRDALRRDSQRSRRQHGDLAVPEPRPAAAIFDLRRASRVFDHPCATAPRAMLEPRERRHVCHALANGRPSSWRPADLPQPRLGLSKRRWTRSRGQRERDGNSASGQDKGFDASHEHPFSQRALTAVYGRFQAISLGSIAKLDEQKAQSTRITPSSPTIASRSSAGNRAITERT